MLRGIFGHALKRVVCAMRLRDCTGCPLEYACTYTTIFETRPRPDAGIMTRYKRAPHPFVLVTDMRHARARQTGHNARIHFKLRLFGDACKAAPFVLRAFEEAGQYGFGKEKTRFSLSSIATSEESGTPWTGEGHYPEPVMQGAPNPLGTSAIFHFRTPLRIKTAGRFCTSESFDPGALAMAMTRRLGLINAFFGHSDDGPDFKALKQESSRLVLLDANLRWHQLRRYSSRQKSSQAIGGLLGSIKLDMTGCPQLRHILAWLPVLHVGKGTSMGLGRVELGR